MKLILSVEDSEISQKLILMRLTKLNHKVVHVGSAKSALESLSNINPDLIIIDFSLPDINGILLLEKIREIKIYKHTPVIIVSSYLNKDVEKKAQDLNAIDYLQKPIDFKHLNDLIDNLAA